MWVFSPVAEGVAVALPCDKLSVQIFTFAKGSRETAPCSNWFPAAQGLFSEPKREVERQNAVAHFSKTALTAASALSVSLVSVKFAGEATSWISAAASWFCHSDCNADWLWRPMQLKKQLNFLFFFFLREVGKMDESSGQTKAILTPLQTAYRSRWSVSLESKLHIIT